MFRHEHISMIMCFQITLKFILSFKTFISFICVYVYVSISTCIHVYRGACVCACTEDRKSIKLLRDIWTPVLLHGSQNLMLVLVILHQELLTVESFSFSILFWWQLGGKWYFRNNISFKIQERIC